MKLLAERDGNTGQSAVHKWGLLLALSIGAEMPLSGEGMSLLLAQVCCHFVLYRLTAREFPDPSRIYKAPLSPGSPSSVSAARSHFAADAADGSPGGVTPGTLPCNPRTGSGRRTRQPASAAAAKESPAELLAVRAPLASADAGESVCC